MDQRIKIHPVKFLSHFFLKIDCSYLSTNCTRGSGVVFWWHAHWLCSTETPKELLRSSLFKWHTSSWIQTTVCLLRENVGNNYCLNHLVAKNMIRAQANLKTLSLSEVWNGHPTLWTLWSNWIILFCYSSSLKDPVISRVLFHHIKSLLLGTYDLQVFDRR